MPAAAELIAIADAVTYELNQGDFAQEFSAARMYTPDFNLSDLLELHVSVVPRAFHRVRLTRGQWQYDYQIDVTIKQRLADEQTQAATDVWCDGLMILVQQIADFLRAANLTNYPAAKSVEGENAPAYDQDDLRQERLFTSVVSQVYRLAR
jgi:hypothetical protein